MGEKGKIKVVYESTNEITLKEAIENVARILSNSRSEIKNTENDMNSNRIA